MNAKLSAKPQQYTKGWVEFYKLKFKVTPDVLIPRPETELLVDEVLKSIKYYVSSIKGIKGKDMLVLDVGTGAGNIAISVAKNLPADGQTPNLKIIATDVSKEALEVAKKNAKLHRVADKIKFIRSNLLSNINCTHFGRSKNMQSLIIVTNLPYIPTARIPYLDSSVKDFEPHVALNGGEDGFELYRRLFQQIKEKIYVLPKAKGKVLRAKQVLILGEIDYTHGELAPLEAQKYFPKAEVEVKKDFTHLQRILTIKFRH